jgi:hypothetical protein
MKSNPALLPISTSARWLAAMTGAGLHAPEGSGAFSVSPLHLPDDEPFWKSVAVNFGALRRFFSVGLKSVA